MNSCYSHDSRLHELEVLTRDYARYSRSAGGMASVLGGLCCIASYLAGGLLAPSSALRVGLIALPLLWLLVKWWMTHHYYQRFGHVEEQAPRVDRLVHVLCTLVVLVVAVSSTVHVDAWPPTAGEFGYLLLLWLLLPASWFCLRSAQDFIVGTFLFCQAALVCQGFTYPIIGTGAAAGEWKLALIALLFPLVALLMIRSGIVDHRRFIALHERLSRLHDIGGAA